MSKKNENGNSKQAELVCCCRLAAKDCDIVCPKGRRLNPDHCFNIPYWDYKNSKDQKA
jgi:hypothetical protein